MSGKSGVSKQFRSNDDIPSVVAAVKPEDITGVHIVVDFSFKYHALMTFSIAFACLMDNSIKPFWDVLKPEIVYLLEKAVSLTYVIDGQRFPAKADTDAKRATSTQNQELDTFDGAKNIVCEIISQNPLGIYSTSDVMPYWKNVISALVRRCPKSWMIELLHLLDELKKQHEQKLFVHVALYEADSHIMFISKLDSKARVAICAKDSDFLRELQEQDDTSLGSILIMAMAGTSDKTLRGMLYDPSRIKRRALQVTGLAVAFKECNENTRAALLKKTCTESKKNTQHFRIHMLIVAANSVASAAFALHLVGGNDYGSFPGIGVAVASAILYDALKENALDNFDLTEMLNLAPRIQKKLSKDKQMSVEDIMSQLVEMYVAMKYPIVLGKVGADSRQVTNFEEFLCGKFSEDLLHLNEIGEVETVLLHKHIKSQRRSTRSRDSDDLHTLLIRIIGRKPESSEFIKQLQNATADLKRFPNHDFKWFKENVDAGFEKNKNLVYITQRGVVFDEERCRQHIETLPHWLVSANLYTRSKGFSIGTYTEPAKRELLYDVLKLEGATSSPGVYFAHPEMLQDAARFHQFIGISGENIGGGVKNNKKKNKRMSMQEKNTQLEAPDKAWVLMENETTLCDIEEAIDHLPFLSRLVLSELIHDKEAVPLPPGRLACASMVGGRRVDLAFAKFKSMCARHRFPKFAFTLESKTWAPVSGVREYEQNSCIMRCIVDRSYTGMNENNTAYLCALRCTIQRRRLSTETEVVSILNKWCECVFNINGYGLCSHCITLLLMWHMLPIGHQSMEEQPTTDEVKRWGMGAKRIPVNVAMPAESLDLHLLSKEKTDLDADEKTRAKGKRIAHRTNGLNCFRDIQWTNVTIPGQQEPQKMLKMKGREDQGLRDALQVFHVTNRVDGKKSAMEELLPATQLDDYKFTWKNEEIPMNERWMLRRDYRDGTLGWKKLQDIEALKTRLFTNSLQTQKKNKEEAEKKKAAKAAKEAARVLKAQEKKLQEQQKATDLARRNLAKAEAAEAALNGRPKKKKAMKRRRKDEYSEDDNEEDDTQSRFLQRNRESRAQTRAKRDAGKQLVK